MQARHQEAVRLGAACYSMEAAALFVWCATEGGGLPAGAINAVFANRHTNEWGVAGEELAAEIALDALVSLTEDAESRALSLARNFPSMLDRLVEAESYARAPVSTFPVGAVVRGTSGSLYLGANIEFRGASLSQTVHAEQAALSNAFMHDEARHRGDRREPSPLAATAASFCTSSPRAAISRSFFRDSRRSP